MHGGPGNPTSSIDWPALRRLAKDYTVVNWDQRDCGLTGIHDSQNTAITSEMMQQDIDRVTDFVLDYMNKDKLTVMGMSWGSKYGGDYAARHPEKVDCLICLSIALDEFSDAYVNQAILDYAEGRIDFHTAVLRISRISVRSPVLKYLFISCKGIRTVTAEQSRNISNS